MDLLLIILTLVAIAHLVYEGAIGPFLRTRETFLLFEQRDRLRRLYIDGGEAIDKEAFSSLESTINATIQHAPQLLVTVIKRMRQECENNDALKAEIKQHTAVVNDCADPEFQDIHHQSLRRFTAIVGINTLPLAIIALPLVAIAVPLLVADAYQRRIKRWLKDGFFSYSRSATA